MALLCWLPLHPCKSQGSHAAGHSTHSAMTWEGHGAGDEVTSFCGAGDPGRGLGSETSSATPAFRPIVFTHSWASRGPTLLPSPTLFPEDSPPAGQPFPFYLGGGSRPAFSEGRAGRGHRHRRAGPSTCWRPSCRRPPSPVCGIAFPPSVPGQRAPGLAGARWQAGLTQMTCSGA